MQVPQESVPVEENVVYKEEEVYQSDPKDILESPESLYFENLAENMKDDELARISAEVMYGYKQDDSSISELKGLRDKYNKLFDLTHEPKNSPWENAANIKLPNLTKACVQFASRAGINSDTGGEIAKIDPVSSDDVSFYRAKNVSKHFNYELKYGTPNHYLSHRKTRIQLARDGYAFRKVYWDSIKKKIISTHILPEDFVVNYYSRDLEDCYRYTHVLKLNDNQVKIKMAQGIYKKIELDDLSLSQIDVETEASKSNLGQNVPQVDYTTPRKILEMHTYIYLKNKDKLRVPVVVTFDYESEKILRIVRRSHPETGEEMKYFINYTFIPNDKSIYGYGFGHLLYNTVSTMSTATNQLINAAALATNGTGFISKGSGLNRGAMRMEMGELKEINARGEDIRKSIYQLDFAPPSNVLMQLLQFLGNQADSLSTVTELMTGGQPRSDTTATAASIAQGESVKLFTDIQKAYHISLGEEFQCMKGMFSIFLDETGVVEISGDDPFQITREDYSTKFTIMPVADPNVINKQETVSKAEFMLNLIKQDPFLQQDPRALLLGTTNLLEAMGINPKKISEIEGIYLEAVQASVNQQAAAQQQAQEAQLQQDQEELSNQQQKNLEEDFKEVEKKSIGGEI